MHLANVHLTNNISFLDSMDSKIMLVTRSNTRKPENSIYWDITYFFQKGVYKTVSLQMEILLFIPNPKNDTFVFTNHQVQLSVLLPELNHEHSGMIADQQYTIKFKKIKTKIIPFVLQKFYFLLILERSPSRLCTVYGCYINDGRIWLHSVALSKWIFIIRGSKNNPDSLMITCPLYE